MSFLLLVDTAGQRHLINADFIDRVDEVPAPDPADRYFELTITTTGDKIAIPGMLDPIAARIAADATQRAQEAKMQNIALHSLIEKLGELVAVLTPPPEAKP